MMPATERSDRAAEMTLLRIFRAGFGTFWGRGERLATARALSALNDHLLKDIGVSRLEIDLGHLAHRDCCRHREAIDGGPSVTVEHSALIRLEGKRFG
ncbi:uncharacterized protein DUF1127 [Rhizobium azibense]|nr:uncharacterized protein DUF1127 [Rhizobium azibense]